MVYIYVGNNKKNKIFEKKWLRLMAEKTKNVVIPNNQQAHIAISDTMGRLVTEYTDVTTNKLIWHGKDGSNTKLPSGVYFLKLEVGDYSATKKLLLIR